MNIEGRHGNSLTRIVRPSQFSPILIIESNFSPVEGTTTGNLVVDASMPYLNIGLLEEPIHMKIKEGYITEIKGGYQAEILKKFSLLKMIKTLFLDNELIIKKGELRFVKS
ncbi:MAG: hypothetical protein ACTSU4_05915 [Promethearchaeota archaeon]